MRIAIIGLLGVSTGLALVAFQLREELEAERARVEVLEGETALLRKRLDEKSTVSLSSLDVERAEASVQRGSESQQADVIRPPDATPTATVARAPVQPAATGARRNRLDDPSVRELELARHKQEIRRRNLGLAEALGLSAEQETALFDLLANQLLDKQMLDLRQEPVRSEEQRNAQRAQREALQRDHEQQLQAQLGYGDYERLRAFQQQMPERQLVSQLRSRLDESSFLKDDQAKRLADAMFEERQLYMQQVRALEGFGGYAMSYPIVAMPRGDPESRIRFAEAQVARTQSFLQRLRQRAEPILSAEQMRRFDEMQEEQLTQAIQLLDRAKRRRQR